MYLLIVILISVLIGFIRRGSIKSIFEHPYKKWYLGLIGIIILGSLNYFYLFANQLGGIIPFLPILNFVGYLLILLMFIFNLDDIFSILIALGLTFDFIVTFINAGFMPVSQGIVDIMPQSAPLTQSLLNGQNVTYAIAQTDTTLLSFMGLILPIPIFTQYVVLAGTIPGLSIGRTFILVGMLGLVQSAMKLPLKEKKPKKKVMQKTEEPNVQAETNKAKQEVPPVRPNTKFDSRTEELFFEDHPLPRDPLDKIFAEDQDEQRTKHIKSINELRKTRTETIELDSDLDHDVEMLTKPLGTGFINSKEVREHLEKGEVEEATEQIDGFFASEFLKDKEKNPVETQEIFTPVSENEVSEEIEEIPSEITEPIKAETEEVNDFILVEPEVSKTTESSIESISELNEETIELINPADVFFDVDQYNLFLESIKDEDFKNEIEAKLAELTRKKKKIPKEETQIEEVKEEPVEEPEVNEESEIEKPEIQETEEIESQEQEKNIEETKPVVKRKRHPRRKITLINSNKQEEVIDLTDKTQEIVDTSKESSENKSEIEEVQIVETEAEVAQEEAQAKENQTVIELPQEPEKEVNETEEKVPEEKIEVTAKEPEEKEENKTELIEQEEKESETIQLPVEIESNEKPVEESDKIIQKQEEIEQPEEIHEKEAVQESPNPEKTEEITEIVDEISSEPENSDKIEVQKDNENLTETESEAQEDIVEQMTTTETTAQEEQEVSDHLSNIILDDIKINGESVSRENINLNDQDIELLEKIMDDATYVSTKRGSFIQDEGSGYFVNKAYKEEKANMDKSEEEMLNVWAQVSQENQNRKMSRRRQASQNFRNVNPFGGFSEPKVETVKEELQVETPTVEQQSQSTVQTSSPTTKDVQSMTNEERKAAGYELVSIEVNGKTISFWQKKN